MSEYFKRLEKNLGRTIQRIRKSKNFTQKDIAGSSMDQSTVGRIENSKVLPSYLYFMEMAYNLGLTVNELIFYTSGNMLSQRDQVIMLINRFNSSADLKFLEQARDFCQRFYQEKQMPFFATVLNCVELYLQYRNIFRPSIDDFIDSVLAEVWEGVMSVSEWHVSEWAILSIVMPILPTHLALLAGEEILAQMNEFDVLTYEMIDIRQQIISNMGHIYLGKKDTKNARGYIEILLIEESELSSFRFGNASLGIGICYLVEGNQSAFAETFFKGICALKFGGHEQYLKTRYKLIIANYPEYKEQVAAQYNKLERFIGE